MIKIRGKKKSKNLNRGVIGERGIHPLLQSAPAQPIFIYVYFNFERKKHQNSKIIFRPRSSFGRLVKYFVFLFFFFLGGGGGSKPYVKRPGLACPLYMKFKMN